MTIQKYSIEELGFILYNNRSVSGVVENFIDMSIDPFKLIEIEKKFEWCKSFNGEKMVEIDISLLDVSADDEIVTKSDLSELSDFVRINVGRFSDKEKLFLESRKFPIDVANKWGFLGLSNFTNVEHLRRIGATCHPILRKLLEDGIDEGGIVQPLFENGELVNCSIRRISNVGKLKYTLAVPDIPVFGLDDIEGEEIWITEGLFDMISLREVGVKAVSPSSAMWSGIQLYKLVEKRPKNIIIFADNDKVGLRTAFIMNRFFNLMSIPSITIHSKLAKDADEHFFGKSLGFDDLETIKITSKMISDDSDDSFNFLRYLQNRKF